MFTFEGKQNVINSFGLTAMIYLKKIMMRSAGREHSDNKTLVLHDVRHPYTDHQLLDNSICDKVLHEYGYVLHDLTSMDQVDSTKPLQIPRAPDIDDTKPDTNVDSVQLCGQQYAVQTAEKPLYVTQCALIDLNVNDNGQAVNPTMMLSTAGLAHTKDIEVQLIDTLQRFVDTLRHRIAQQEDVFKLKDNGLEFRGVMKLHTMPYSHAHIITLNFDIRNKQNGFLHFVDNDMMSAPEINPVLMPGLLHRHLSLTKQTYSLQDLPEINCTRYINGLEHMFESVFTMPAYVLAHEQPTEKFRLLFNHMHFPIGGARNGESFIEFQSRVSNIPFAAVLAQQQEYITAINADAAEPIKARYITELSHMSIVIELQKQANVSQGTFAYNFLRQLLCDIDALFTIRQKLLPQKAKFESVEFGCIPTPQDTDELWERYKHKYIQYGTNEMNLFCIGLTAILCATKQALIVKDQREILSKIDALNVKFNIAFSRLSLKTCTKLCDYVMDSLAPIILEHSGGAAATLSLAALSIMNLSTSLYSIATHKPHGAMYLCRSKLKRL